MMIRFVVAALTTLALLAEPVLAQGFGSQFTQPGSADTAEAPSGGAPVAAPGAAPAAGQKAAPAPRTSAKIPVPGKIPPVSMAVLDLEYILRESMAGRSLTEQYQRQAQAIDAEFKKREQDIRTAGAELDRQRGTLSPETAAQREKDLNSRIVDFKADAETRQRQLGTAAAAAQRELEGAVGKIVQQIIAERGLNMVVQKRALVANSPDLEISGEVVQRLDRDLPKVTLKLAGR